MTTRNFENIIKSYKKGVCKVTCQNIPVDVNLPFESGADEPVCGTGWFCHHRYLYLENPNPKNFYLISNAHVIEAAASRTVSIQFPYLGTSKIYGKVIKVCHALDFAIIELEDNEFNRHLKREVGKDFYEIMRDVPMMKPNEKVINTEQTATQDVIALGYPLDSDDAHLSHGKVSGKHEYYLQLNQSISSGNSGGPLFNNRGQVIGICAADFDDSEGITLAIPWSGVAKLLMDYQKEDTFVIYPPRLGFVTERLIEAYAITVLKNNGLHGALVKQVFDVESGKYNGRNLKKGDVVLSIGDNHKEYEIDSHGLVTVDTQCDKIPFHTLNFLLLLDPGTTYINFYSKGKEYMFQFALQSHEEKMVNYVMPALETVDSCIVAGMVFTNFTKNHLDEIDDGIDSTIINFLTSTNGGKKAVVCTAAKTPSSLQHQGYYIKKLSVLEKVNKKKIPNIATMKVEVAKLVKAYITKPSTKTRFFRLCFQNDYTVIVDLQLASLMEPLLWFSKGFPKHLSLTNALVGEQVVEVAKEVSSGRSNKKRKIK